MIKHTIECSSIPVVVYGLSFFMGNSEVEANVNIPWDYINNDLQSWWEKENGFNPPVPEPRQCKTDEDKNLYHKYADDFFNKYPIPFVDFYLEDCCGYKYLVLSIDMDYDFTEGNGIIIDIDPSMLVPEDKQVEYFIKIANKYNIPVKKDDMRWMAISLESCSLYHNNLESESSKNDLPF